MSTEREDTVSGNGKTLNKGNKEYAIHGAKVYCPFCTIPTGDLIVTSHNVMMQGKYTATVADCMPMTNIIFKGQCTVAAGLVPPPCSAVIRLEKWMNYAPDVYIRGNNALLTESVIPCLMGGSQIRIVDSGQVVKKIKSEPMPLGLEIVEMFWVDETLNYKLEHVIPGDTAYLYVKTENYDEGQSVRIKIPECGQSLVGEVNGNGETLIKWTCPDINE